MKKTPSVKMDLERGKEIRIWDIVKEFPDAELVLAVKVNGMAMDNNAVLNRFGKGVVFEPIYKKTLEGEAILRRSFVFLLGMAMSKLLGENKPYWFVRHQVRSGYFCEIEGVNDVDETLIKDIEKMMRELSEKRIPITKTDMYYEDAVNLFRKTKEPLTVKLLESHNFYDVPVDKCEDFSMLHHRVLAPNTSFLTEFSLKKRAHGFLLIHKFKKIDDYYDSPVEIEDKRTIQIIKDQSEFIKMSGVTCIGDINKLAITSDIENFVCLCNTFHEKLMNSMVRRIREKVGVRLILIAGPSASGKTTFASKLRNVLRCKGIKSYTISVDNYFRPNVECPIDPESGHYDFESLEALRIDLLNEHLLKLLKGEKVFTPEFNFHKGEPKDNVHPLQIEESSVLIMEGIHCLNDKLTPLVETDKKYKIFIAPLSVINYDDKNYISNATLRLMRRIVRDKMHRGHSVEETLRMWDNVRRSEHQNIFPYMNEAQFIFNSAFDYEVGVLKRYVKPLLRTVSPDSVYFDKAQQLIRFLMFVIPVPYKYVPRDSLLQEFIKGHWLN